MIVVQIFPFEPQLFTQCRMEETTKIRTLSLSTMLSIAIFYDLSCL